MTDDPVALALAGNISPQTALARLVLNGVPPREIAARLPPEAHALRRLARSHAGFLLRLAEMIARSGMDHQPGTAETIARAFDTAVAVSPEASVAAFSLGDPALLDQATAEIIAWLEATGLIRPDHDVLDLGCGIGRIGAALAPRVHSVLGVDASAGMIAEARRRHAGIPGLRFAHVPGTNLAMLPGASFDLVLAVDSFPYLMLAGTALAERHVGDAARILRRGGRFAILNLSYRGDIMRDRADAARWARCFGISLLRNGETPFHVWDGTAFVFSLDASPAGDQAASGLPAPPLPDPRTRRRTNPGTPQA